jgi:hypothetical protein
MPDKRTHRGPHPDDARLFGNDTLPPLRLAAADYCWLLNRGYPPAATLALVGNRYQLDRRQRLAVARFACTDAERDARLARQSSPANAANTTLLIDGFNVLTTVEAALSGAVVLAGRDGTFRDLAGMHGTYRKVQETVPALELIGATLAQWRIATCRWLLDSPVSNSGRLKTVMLQTAALRGWPWEVNLDQNPDAVLKRSCEPVATADSIVLDACGRWMNLARAVVEVHVPRAWVVTLEEEIPRSPSGRG